MYVFVYGTLKQGYGNHRLLKGKSLYMGEAELLDYGVFPLPYGFPGILPKEGEIVKGELYSIDEQVLNGLDCLEGFYEPNHPHNMYERVEVEVVRYLEWDRGGAIIPRREKAYTYVWARDEKPEYYEKMCTEWNR